MGSSSSGAAPSFPLPLDDCRIGDLDEAAATSRRQVTAFRSVGASVRTLEKRAGGEVLGMLLPEIGRSARKVTDASDRLSSAALAASATMRAYATGVGRYNGVVGELNEEYAQAKGRGFGVADDAGAEDDMSASEKREAHADAVDAADLALRQRLGRRERASRQTLDDLGDHLAANLGKSPRDALVGIPTQRQMSVADLFGLPVGSVVGRPGEVRTGPWSASQITWGVLNELPMTKCLWPTIDGAVNGLDFGSEAEKHLPRITARASGLVALVVTATKCQVPAYLDTAGTARKEIGERGSGRDDVDVTPPELPGPVPGLDRRDRPSDSLR